jgi:predicted DNA binding CopG/RHH family protein
MSGHVHSRPDERMNSSDSGRTRCNYLEVFSVNPLFQHAKQQARREQTMKIEALKQRLDRNRPMTSVTIRIPEDVVEDLKRVAPLLGFSGYQPLIRAYIGQCLRVDLERFESETVTALVASLKRRGVSDIVINEALSEIVHTQAS